MIRLADPYLLLLLIPAVSIFFFSRETTGRIRFSNIKILKEVVGNNTINPKLILKFIRFIVLVFLIFAISRPQSGRKFTEVTSEGIDIILTIDTSGSMMAQDFKIDGKQLQRLDIVKIVVTDFIDKRASDRMGLVVFGDEAYTQCPLTLDHGILMDFLDKIKIGMVGQSTAVGSAIGISVNRIKDLKSKSKIIILLTDGENTSGQINPLKAAEIAKTYGVKIYTIGVGSNGPAPFLVETIFGKRFHYQDVKLDEKSLIEIARITDGKYYRAKNTGQLEKIYKDIDKLEKVEVKVKEYTEYNELFHYFLLMGLIVLLFELILANTKLRKIP